MITGRGLIAESLKSIDSENFLFFASGVSNSLETKTSEFEREHTLLKNSMAEHPEKKIVYFSTLSIHDQSKKDSLYVIHKLKIERFIQNNTDNYLILRIGNIVGKGGNPNTLFNFLKSKIESGSSFSLHNKARRLFIDIDDISGFLKKNGQLKNQIVNVAFPDYYDLKTVVEAIQQKIGKKAAYQEIEFGDFYHVPFCENITDHFKGIAAEDYLQNLIKKYI